MGGYALLKDEHVRIDIFQSKFSKRWKKIVDFICFVLLFFPFVIAMLAQVLVPIFGLRGVVVSKTEVHKKMMLGMAISFTVKILIVLTGIGLDTIFIVATANIAYQILVGVFSTYHIKNILGINLCLIKPRLAG